MTDNPDLAELRQRNRDAEVDELVSKGFHEVCARGPLMCFQCGIAMSVIVWMRKQLDAK